MEVQHCGVCGVEEVFDRLPCGDGHGEDCPDLVCLRCGDVVVVGPVPMAGDSRTAARRVA